MIVNICGLPYMVVERNDDFDIDTHFGQIDFKKSIIKINSELSETRKEEILCHEITHGMLTHLGYDEYSQDEQFVTVLGNAIYQTFKLKEVKNEQ